MCKNTENLLKMIRGVLFGAFCRQCLIISSKERHLSLRTLSPLQRSHTSYESILPERQVSTSKSLSYSKICKNAENLSKMIRGALFETFGSQYQIVPSKDLYFQGLSYFRTGCAVHMT